MDVLKTCVYILNNEPEEWLNFSSGQNSKSNLERYKPSSEISGKLFRLLIYFRWFFYRFNPFSPIIKNKRDTDILIFASSINQLSVLEPINKRLKKRNVKVISISDFPMGKELSNWFSGWNKICFDYKIFILSIILFFKYIFPLLNRLNEIDQRLSSLRLNGFLSVYAWLPYYYTCLKIIKPSIVLLSNDHNPENRCLIEIARHFGIKTAYVQHGGISERFHSLDFDYNFLDGQYSLDTYKRVENRRSPKSRPPEKRIVMLTGNLRRLQKKQRVNKKCEIIGLTVKGRDSLRELAQLCMKLNTTSKIIVRPHPNIKFNKFIQQLKNELPNQIGIEFSDPRSEKVGIFLNSIDLVIAGNSTILLEAALVGAIPLYFKHPQEKIDDYYGFVKNGLVPKFESQEEMLKYIKTISPDKYSPNMDVLNYYNVSSNDKFDDEADKVVAENLISLIRYGKLKSQNFVTI